MNKRFPERIAIVIFAMVTMVSMIVSSCVTIQSPQSTQSPSTSVPASGGNRPPTITSFTSDKPEVFVEGKVGFQAVADDLDNDRINYVWSATAGAFEGGGAITTWQAPKQPGTYEITVKVDDGKGGSAQKSMTMKVISNRNPTISKITADPAVIAPGASSLITCEASDPDGDPVHYSWSVKDGTITGTGNRITWFPPNKGGTYNIVVLVKDDKGGEATTSTTVSVATSSKSATFNYVKEESGTVGSDGDRDRTFFKAGDNENNIGYRAFWSFNIFSLNRTEIKDARLIFTTKSVSGNPFVKVGSESLDGLRIWKVTYSEQLPAFNITGQQLQKAGAAFWDQPTVIDVTPEIDYAVKSAANRFQIEALFNKAANGDGIAQFIEWSDVKLEVSYTEIP
ncbi:MAG TPA: hypothetical protein DCX22_02385 [Dehalococcoidia bacterium]|nr:hypothetical protein [Dehalococcoidia bacterium]